MPLVKSQRSTPSPRIMSAPMPWRCRTAALHVATSGRNCSQRGGPLDGDGIGSHPAHMPLQRHRHVFMVDLAFHEAVHGIQEVLAVVARVKTEDVGRQHVQQHLALPRAHAEGLGVGPGNVPEQRNGGLGYPPANEVRQQREMKILDEHHGTVGVSIRRRPRRRTWHSPLRRNASRWRETPAAHRPDAQRPEPFVGKTHSSSPAPALR